jgi:hypothetical protein
MKAFHYGWIIVGVGVLVKMAALGFGRFAYPIHAVRILRFLETLLPDSQISPTLQ